jgi:hypothetical protein
MIYSRIISASVFFILVGCSSENNEIPLSKTESNKFEKEKIYSKTINSRRNNEFLKVSEVSFTDYPNLIWSSDNEDLNGDKIEDKIRVFSSIDYVRDENSSKNHVLMICIDGFCIEQTVSWSGASYYGKKTSFEVIDIDRNDNMKEFLISFKEKEEEDPSTNHVILRYLKNKKISINEVFSSGYSNGQMEFVNNKLNVHHNRYPDVIGTYGLKGDILEEIQMYRQPESEVDYSMMAACPFVYVLNNNSFVYQGEILRYLNADFTESWQRLPLTAHNTDTLRVKISEEKDETTYINTLYLTVGDKIIKPTITKETHMTNFDNDEYLRLKKGQSIEFTFNVKNLDLKNVYLNMKGYYIPDIEYVSSR